MKRLVPFVALVVLVTGIMLWAQFSSVKADVGPNALLYLLADSQRELTRMPAAFTRLPDEQEIKVGGELAKLYAPEASETNSDLLETEKYVQQVGRNLQPHASRKLPYQFHVIPDRMMINAFALPGGHIFIGDGLLSLFDTEDEVAAVLAHEIEHVDHYHCAERLQVEAALRKVPAGALLELPIELFQAGYTKDQEMEADREGVRLMDRAGYSPTGMLRVMQTFDQLYQEVRRPPENVVDETQRVMREAVEGYFRSHPLPSERISEIQRTIASDSPKTLNERPLQIAYIYLSRKAEHEIAALHADQAFRFASRALEQNPAYGRALYVRSASALVRGDLSTATSDYRKLAQGSNEAAASIESAVNAFIEELMRRHKWSDAVDLADRMLTLEPGVPGTAQLKIRSLVSSGRIDEAQVATSKLRTLYPSVADEVVNSLATAGQNDAAQHRYIEALLPLQFAARERHSAGDFRLLASTLFSLGRFDSAADAMQRAIENSQPEDLDVSSYRLLADSLAAAKFPTAIKRFEESSKFDTHSTHATDIAVERFGLRVMSGQGDAVLREWNASVMHGDIAPETAERLSWWYLRAGNPSVADALLRQTLSLRPATAPLRYSLLWAEIEKGQQSASTIVQIDEAILAKPPLYLSIPLAQAITAWRMGKRDEAIAQFDAFTSAAPEWRNPDWRNPLQPPAIAKVASELQAESDRRRELARNRLRK